MAGNVFFQDLSMTAQLFQPFLPIVAAARALQRIERCSETTGTSHMETNSAHANGNLERILQ
jgi:hypothetical protein